MPLAAFVGIAMFSMALLSGLHTQAAATLWYFIIIAVFVVGNVMPLTCSYLYARAIQLERIYWSITAERMRAILVIERLNKSRNMSTYCCVKRPVKPALLTVPADCLSQLWDKFTIAFSSNTAQFYIAPIHIQLTYRRIIEINFFAVLLYTITR